MPGTVDGMIKVHTKYGKLRFREVIQPAIDLAEDGFHVTESRQSHSTRTGNTLLRKNSVRPAFVKDSRGRKEICFVSLILQKLLKE